MVGRHKAQLRLVDYDSLAAVDLGSNSFHLQIGRVVDEQIYPLDSLREPVRLGAGLTRDKRLDRATQARALEALARFGERLRGFPPGAVRAVGTNALRVAKNAAEFLAEAERVLGFPIEVIFGREEARLIYLGVSHALPPSPDRRLVADIGGGSTEFIIGTGYEPQVMESLPMGCVSYSLRFFPDGRIEKGAMKKAELAASNEVQRIVGQYRKVGWRHAVASSGTARSIAAVLAAQGWADGRVTPEGVDRLRSALVKAGDVARLALPALKPDRVAILPGGVAIMSAILAELGIAEMEVSDGALRQGVLYDLLGRVQHHDMREATVSQFMRRYHVDAAQAARVEALALRLYREIAGRPRAGEAQLLRWAASLHEIGLSIAQTGYHKHSAYILSNADMPGFSQADQQRLARVVLAHRGKLTKLESLPMRSADWDLIFAMRIAALFHRSRVDVALPPLGCRETDSGFQLLIPSAWLESHPLTAAALESEEDDWKALGMRLDVKGVAADKLAAAG
ncbi:MAG: exopolyphosphatase [Burkholderiales bacterium]|nr:exopolyphosphatase [Burkholderiales bacterium]